MSKTSKITVKHYPNTNLKPAPQILRLCGCVRESVTDLIDYMFKIKISRRLKITTSKWRFCEADFIKKRNYKLLLLFAIARVAN